MKTLIRAIISTALILSPISAMADCTTQTYQIDGRYMICTTCCYYGNCNTTCI